MAVRMTERQFRQALQGNPCLRYTVQGGKENAGPSGDSLPEKEKAGVGRSCEPGKYRNRKVYVYGDGFVSFEKDEAGHGVKQEKFDSIKEYRRWKELELLEKQRDIRELRRQVRLSIQPAFRYGDELVQKIEYVADFIYTDSQGRRVVEDVKGYDAKKKRYITTAEFRLKWKLLKAKYSAYIFRLW